MAKRRQNDGKGTEGVTTGVILKYFKPKMFVCGSGAKRGADEMDGSDGMVANGGDGDHGSKCTSKRMRKMNDFVSGQAGWGSKSKTPDEPSPGEDDDSSQLTTISENGSGKLSKLTSRNPMGIHESGGGTT